MTHSRGRTRERMSRLRSTCTAFGTVRWWGGGDTSPTVLTAVSTWKFDKRLLVVV